jgi:hypothetical protein
VHKVEADMSNLPAFAPFMRTLSAVVDQRLWSRGLDIELKKEREARQDNEGVDELHGAVDYDIPFPLFSRLQNATQGGLLSLAQTQTNQLNANNANVRNGTSHSRHSSATGSAFGGSAGGKTYSATTGGSASFKTEQQRKAETDALLQAAAAEVSTQCFLIYSCVVNLFDFI